MYHYWVHRTQILLEERQYEALAALARRSGQGLSALIRQAVDRLLGVKRERRKSGGLRALCGIVSGRPGPSGRDHDRVLYGRPS